MKAECIHEIGGPEVLQLEEVPRPKPKRKEILVRVHAAGVNPVDWKIREGLLGPQPLPSVMGSDFSGEIVELGEGVEGFRVGQEVFGTVGDDSGSYAEYAIAPVSHVAEKPAGLEHILAAALPIATLTAWQALFDVANLQPGQKVLIHAAAGGVGSFAVKLAKWKEAFVIGTASGQHVEIVRGYGADQIVDYRTSRFEQVAREMDVVLDTIGGDTQERSWGVLKRGGILVSIVQPPPERAATAHGVRGTFLRCNLARADQLMQIASLVRTGRLSVSNDRVLPLSEAAQAQELSKKGHANGKIVLSVS